MANDGKLQKKYYTSCRSSNFFYIYYNLVDSNICQFMMDISIKKLIPI